MRALMGILVALMVLGIYFGCQDRLRLMDQCMKDGKKEYECRAMLDKNHQSYPVIIYH